MHVHLPDNQYLIDRQLSCIDFGINMVFKYIKYPVGTDEVEDMSWRFSCLVISFNKLLVIINEATAKPTAPPKDLMTFRQLITTALSDFAWLCAATIVGWKVHATPVPINSNTTVITP